MAQISVSLFVSGTEARRSGFIGTVLRTCERHMFGRFRLTVVDVDDEPQVALEEGLLVTPALVFDCGRRKHRIVGDLRNERQLSEEIRQVAADVDTPGIARFDDQDGENRRFDGRDDEEGGVDGPDSER